MQTRQVLTLFLSSTIQRDTEAITIANTVTFDFVEPNLKEEFQSNPFW